jgi:hypothetical protein
VWGRVVRVCKMAFVSGSSPLKMSGGGICPDKICAAPGPFPSKHKYKIAVALKRRGFRWLDDTVPSLPCIWLRRFPPGHSRSSKGQTTVLDLG